MNVHDKNWRTTIQKLYELTNWIPIQEDIKTALASLTAPVLKHVPRLKFPWIFIETISYPSIITTDAQVYNYITGIVEEMHKLPKSTKWERTEEAYEVYPQEEGYDEECLTLSPKTAQEQGYVEEADEGSDDAACEEQISERENRKRMIAEASKRGLTAVQKLLEQEDYNDENYQEEIYEEGYAEEAYEGYDDRTYEEEGYDDEAYDGYDDGTYEQEEGYEDEAYEQEDWYGDEAYQDQDQEQEWYGDEAYQEQEQEWYGDEAYQDQEQEWYGDEAETYEEDTSQYGQCIFFASPEGCQRGNECKYRHDCDPNTGEPLPASSKNKKRYRQPRRREQVQEAYVQEDYAEAEVDEDYAEAEADEDYAEEAYEEIWCDGAFHCRPIDRAQDQEQDEDEVNHRKPCKFFASPQGCRSGDRCKFRHDEVYEGRPLADGVKYVRPPPHLRRPY